jgi:hypothetical protein
LRAAPSSTVAEDGWSAMLGNFAGYRSGSGICRNSFGFAIALICVLSIPMMTIAKAETHQWYRWLVGAGNPDFGVSVCVPSAISPGEEYKAWKSRFQTYEPYIDVVLVDGRSNPGLAPDQVNVCFRGGASEFQGPDCEEFFRSMESCRAITKAATR